MTYAPSDRFVQQARSIQLRAKLELIRHMRDMQGLVMSAPQAITVLVVACLSVLEDLFALHVALVHQIDVQKDLMETPPA